MIEWIDVVPKAQQMMALAYETDTLLVNNWVNTVGQVGRKSFENSVRSGGMTRTKKGGARIDTADMLNSIDEDNLINAGFGQVKTGFIDNAPHYTRYQEHGTKRGIPPMMAVAQARMDMSQAVYSEGWHLMDEAKDRWDSI